MEKWLQVTWEGIVSWAFHSAQRFHFSLSGDNTQPTICRGTSELLHSFLKVSILSSETPQLSTQNHSLNLVTLQKESDVPVGFENVKANWPGLVFEFEPKPPISGGNSSSSDKFVEVSADEIALVECLLLASGIKREQRGRLCPLKTLIWARSANPQILSRSASAMGAFFSDEKASKFKGSNESGKALALKADVARWIRQTDPNAKRYFESTLQTKASGAEKGIDLHVEGHGQFEVETMNGSGPIEAFYHQKVFSRLSGQDESFRLVVPNDAVLWAGVYLADIAHHLRNRGKVLIPSADGAYLEIEARALLNQSSLEIPWDELRPNTDTNFSTSSESAIDTQIRLSDVAGYKDVRDRIDELVIWPEQHQSQMSRPSRTSGILLFGPPGCGKSRLARAIAGELEQEVRLLSPSDLRGAYVGWGQILIKEQFNWVAAGANRMLVFDELDAIARSRRGGDRGWMISDEMADVNELLVQLDRVTRLGRIIVGTTNYIDSLDDAVVRSGRFGRFIPVGPPDVDESVAILVYYLEQIRSSAAQQECPPVEIPSTEQIRSLIAPLIEKNQGDNCHFCGADLEEAVNQTYSRCLRRALESQGRDSGKLPSVKLTDDDLAEFFRSVSRSVSVEAMEQFKLDINRYCGGRDIGKLTD